MADVLEWDVGAAVFSRGRGCAVRTMPTHLFDHRAENRENRAVWLGSLAVHAALLVGLGYLSWTTLGPGAAERDGGGPIVVGLQDDANDADGGPAANGLAAESGSAAEELLSTAPEGDAPMAPLEELGASTGSLAPAPRLPLLSLDGEGAGNVRATGAATRGGPGGGSGAGRPGSLGRQLDRLAERASVTVFGAVGEGSRFVYLFDRSTSMTGTPLAAAKRQLLGSLEALSSVHQFHVIFFNHEVQSWDLTGGQQRVPFASEANKQSAAQFLRTVTAAGGTERVKALRRALEFQPDVIFFLTDADDEMSHFEIADVVERAQGSGTEIACIEFGDGPGRGPRPLERGNFLTRLAAETGGDYVYVDVTTLGR